MEGELSLLQRELRLFQFNRLEPTALRRRLRDVCARPNVEPGMFVYILSLRARSRYVLENPPDERSALLINSGRNPARPPVQRDLRITSVVENQERTRKLCTEHIKIRFRIRGFVPRNRKRA